MKIQNFLLINSILFYSCRNINIYEKFSNSRKLEGDDDSTNDSNEEEEENNTSDEVDDDQKENENENSTYIIPPLLFGFDQYEFSNNTIQFVAYIRIIEFGEIYNITLPISIESDQKLRNLKKKTLILLALKKVMLIVMQIYIYLTVHTHMIMLLYQLFLILKTFI